MENKTQAVTQTNPQQEVDYSKWYFKYDPTTYAFIPGAVHEKVDNSTDVEPTGLMNPVWSPSTNTWTGKTYAEFAQEQQANAQPVSDPVQKQIAGLTQMIIAQQAELATLKAQQTTTATATAQPSQTASQTTSQSASQSTTQSASQSTSQSTSAVTGGTTNV